MKESDDELRMQIDALIRDEIVKAQVGDDEYGPKREGDAAKTDANISKAMDSFGWEPVNTLEDIVRTEIECQSSKKK